MANFSKSALDQYRQIKIKRVEDLMDELNYFVIFEDAQQRVWFHPSDPLLKISFVLNETSAESHAIQVYRAIKSILKVAGPVALSKIKVK